MQCGVDAATEVGSNASQAISVPPRLVFLDGSVARRKTSVPFLVAATHQFLRVSASTSRTIHHDGVRATSSSSTRRSPGRYRPGRAPLRQVHQSLRSRRPSPPPVRRPAEAGVRSTGVHRVTTSASDRSRARGRGSADACPLHSHRCGKAPAVTRPHPPGPRTVRFRTKALADLINPDPSRIPVDASICRLSMPSPTRSARPANAPIESRHGAAGAVRRARAQCLRRRALRGLRPRHRRAPARDGDSDSDSRSAGSSRSNDSS